MTLPESALGSQLIIPSSAMIATPLGLQRRPLGLQRQPLGSFTPPNHSAISPQTTRRSVYGADRPMPFTAFPADFAFPTVQARSQTPCLGQVIQSRLTDHPLLRSPQLLQRVPSQALTQELTPEPSPGLQSCSLPLSRFTLPPGFTLPSPSVINPKNDGSDAVPAQRRQVNDPPLINRAIEPSGVESAEIQLPEIQPREIAPTEIAPTDIHPAPNAPTLQPAEQNSPDNPEGQQVPRSGQPAPQPFTRPSPTPTSPSVTSLVAPPAPPPVTATPTNPSIQPSSLQSPAFNPPLPSPQSPSPSPQSPSPFPQSPSPQTLSPSPQSPISPTSQLPGPQRQVPTGPFPVMPKLEDTETADRKTDLSNLNVEKGAIANPLQAPNITPTQQKGPNTINPSLDLPALPDISPSIEPTIVSPQVFNPKIFNPKIAFPSGLEENGSKPLMPVPTPITESSSFVSEDISPAVSEDISPDINSADLSLLSGPDPRVLKEPWDLNPLNIRDLNNDGLLVQRTRESTFSPLEEIAFAPAEPMVQPLLSPDIAKPIPSDITRTEQLDDLDSANLQPKLDIPLTDSDAQEDVALKQERPDAIHDVTSPLFSDAPQPDPALLQRAPIPSPSTLPFSPLDLPTPSNLDNTVQQRPNTLLPRDGTIDASIGESSLPLFTQPVLQPKTLPFLPLQAPQGKQAVQPKVINPKINPKINPTAIAPNKIAPKTINPTTIAPKTDNFKAINPKTNTLPSTLKPQRLPRPDLNRSAEPVGDTPSPVTQRSSKTHLHQRQQPLAPLGQWQSLHIWQEQLINKRSLDQPQNPTSDVSLPRYGPYRPSIQPQTIDQPQTTGQPQITGQPQALRQSPPEPAIAPPLPPTSIDDAIETFTPETSDSPDATTVQPRTISPQHLAPQSLTPPSPLPDVTPTDTPSPEITPADITPADITPNTTPVDIAPKNWSSIEDLLAQQPPAVQAKEAWESQFPLLSPSSDRQSPQTPKTQVDSSAPEMISAKLDLNALLSETLSDDASDLDVLETAIPDSPMLRDSSDLPPEIPSEPLAEVVPSPSSMINGDPDQDTLELLAHTLYQTVRSRLSSSQAHHHRPLYDPLPWTSAIHLPSSKAQSRNTQKPRASPPCPYSRKVEDLLWYVHDNLTHRLRRDRDRHGSD
ncbi:MAG: hypothetical protein AAGD25_02870 [Cyanobacteria bacterium P01_F01_bin.150]